MTEALTFVHRLDDPVRLASGRYSKWFVDAEILWQDELTRALVLNAFLDYLEPQYRWEAQPVPHGGDVWTAALNERLEFRGQPDRPKSFAVIEDVTTTGGSATKRRAGTLQAAPVLAVVARGQFRPDFAWLRLRLPDYETYEEAKRGR